MSNLEYKKINKELVKDAKTYLKMAIMSKNKAKIKILLSVVTKILGTENTNKIIEDLKQRRKKKITNIVVPTIK